MISVRDVFEARLSSFDGDHCWNLEQDGVVRAFQNTGELIRLCFGEREAAIAMTALRLILRGDAEALRGGLAGDAGVWPSEGCEALGVWPRFFDDLLALRAFAEFGIYSPWRHAGREDLTSAQVAALACGDDVQGWVGDAVERIDRVVGLAPDPEAGARYDALLTTRNRALARLKFDGGEALSVQELADLSGVSAKRVQNASYEGGEGAPVIDKRGLVTPDSARQWLTRKGFKFSIWREIAALAPLSSAWGEGVAVDHAAVVNDDLDDVVVEASVAGVDEDAYVFVPVAADGSRFSPDLRRRDGYAVGPKDCQRVIEDYFEALDWLAAQPVPRWRRPSATSGVAGVVSGRGWERVRRADLLSAANAALRRSELVDA